MAHLFINEDTGRLETRQERKLQQTIKRFWGDELGNRLYEATLSFSGTTGKPLWEAYEEVLQALQHENSQRLDAAGRRNCLLADHYYEKAAFG